MQRVTYWITYVHLDKQNGLLPPRQGTEVDRSQPTYIHSTETVEERIDIRDVIATIARIKYAGKDEWCYYAEEVYR